MSEKFIRLYKKLDINELKKHLMIYGDISANCANCNAFNIKIDMTNCPECGTEFKYISFRNIGVHMPKVIKLVEEKPQMLIIDHDDFKRSLGALKAEEFLK
jgi:inorganic pyrophosphatase/exopolyphosphatase